MSKLLSVVIEDMSSNAVYCSLLVFLISLDVSVSNDQCLLDSKDVSKTKLLDSITVLTPTKYFTAKSGFSYAVTICSDVSKVNHPNASVTRTLMARNTTTVLGRHNETDIINLGDNRVLLTYSGGDYLNESSYCNNTRWKTLVFITCDYDADDINIDLLDPLNGGCFALFHLKTSLSCPPKQSRVLSWFLLIIFAITTYFTIGIFYRRYVKGAKGWEQVPHHDFWTNPLQHVMEEHIPNFRALEAWLFCSLDALKEELLLATT